MAYLAINIQRPKDRPLALGPMQSATVRNSPQQSATVRIVSPAKCMACYVDKSVDRHVLLLSSHRAGLNAVKYNYSACSGLLDLLRVKWGTKNLQYCVTRSYPEQLAFHFFKEPPRLGRCLPPGSIRPVMPKVNITPLNGLERLLKRCTMVERLDVRDLEVLVRIVSPSNFRGMLDSSAFVPQYTRLFSHAQEARIPLHCPVAKAKAADEPLPAPISPSSDPPYERRSVAQWLVNLH
ncbi:ctd nuclear envelope phosphatase 1-like [Plakobranchus ocellatus]|uniref:Ctd nuclear envelope phosphatase 1-like n=1 Tax=Plakobranchus ocellatus TaxID=259542 RepID=A0AAV4AJ90_9GAST|nr:ctd nuclear envelope phosphatase 1-like [Plakobranchus ocellatus]